jgi:hypothetical protein
MVPTVAQAGLSGRFLPPTPASGGHVVLRRRGGNVDLLTQELRQALLANGAHRDGIDRDPVPVVKFFNPCGAATWLATELDADGDTLFGLADLGFGCPELGSFSLAEIAAVRLRFGLRVERDLHFTTEHRLSEWADAARHAGSIIGAATFLRRAASARATGLSDPSGD